MKDYFTKNRLIKSFSSLGSSKWPNQGFLQFTFIMLSILSFSMVGNGQTVLDHTFESGADGWTAGGSVGGLTFQRVAEPFGGNGTTGWSTTPFNNYGDDDGAHVTSSTIDLSGFTAMTLSVDVRYNTESGFDGMTLFYSTDGGTTWLQLGNNGEGTNWFNNTGVDGPNDIYAEITSDPHGWSGDNSGWETATLPLPPATFDMNSNIMFRMYFGSDGSSTDDGVAFDNFKITGTATGPTISATPTSLNNLDYCETNGPSASQTTSVSGSSLTADIVVTAPTNYEVSLDGVSFSASVTLTEAGGSVPATTVYTRLKEGLSTATYNENITITSTGATDVMVSVSGDVTANPITVDAGPDQLVSVSDPINLDGTIAGCSSTNTTLIDEDFGTSCGTPVGWTSTGGKAWTFTSSSLTYGPTSGNGGSGCYAGHDGSSNDNEGLLQSPVIDLSSYDAASLTLYVWQSDVPSEGFVTVNISTDGGATFPTEIANYSGITYATWTQVTVDLSAYAGMSNIALEFEANDITDFDHDPGIDDIVVTGTTNCTISWTGPNSFTSSLEDDNVTGSAAAIHDGYYYLTASSSGCSATDSVLITVGCPPDAGTLSGDQTICVDSTTTFSSDAPGGTWSSDLPAIATINAATGVVTGVSAGLATMTYTISAPSCAVVTATRTVTVTDHPDAGTLSGTNSICDGQTSNFTSDGDAGGTWASDDTGVATVDAAGLVTSVAPGTANITYTVTGMGGCSDETATRMITVNTPPDAGALSGTTTTCVGQTTTISSDGDAGGTWSSDMPAIATVDAAGVVTGVGVGTATISYTVTAGTCPNDVATIMVTINAGINAGTLSGTDTVCVGSMTTFTSDGDAGGAWTTSDAGIATVDGSGNITGVSAGDATITYTVSGAGCTDETANRNVRVNATPNAGTVTPVPACVGGMVTFTSDGDAGGTWTSDNTGIATVNASTGEVTGVAAGAANITYTVTATGCPTDSDTQPVAVAAACNNDECVDAFPVTVDGPATNSIDVSNYTQSAGHNTAGCDAYQWSFFSPSKADAWYSFVAPASGAVHLSIDNSNLTVNNGGQRETDWAIVADCDGVCTGEDAAFPDRSPSSTGQYLETGNTYVTGLNPGQTYYFITVNSRDDSGDELWVSGTYSVSISDAYPELTTGVSECADFSVGEANLADANTGASCEPCSTSDPDWWTSTDIDKVFRYVATATGTVDIDVTNIDNFGTTPEMGFMFTTDIDAACGGAEVLAYGCNNNGSAARPDLTATGVAVTSGTTYYIVVSQEGSSTFNRTGTFCVEVNLSCATAQTVSVPTVDCSAGTYTGRINFSSLGSLGTTFDLIDDEGTMYTGIGTGINYDFNYTDVNAHTITVRGYDGSSNLICSEEFDLKSACNGSDDFDISAPNILYTCQPGDLASATAGTAQGFTPSCDGSGGAAPGLGNNFIRDCSAANFDNNTDWFDVWYQVDLPDGTDELTMTVTGLTGEDVLGFVIYTADPGADAGANVATVDGNFECSFFEPSVASHTVTGLADESTAPLYIRILAINYDDSDGCGAINHPDCFTICATAPQPNDVCANAQNITVNNLDNTGVCDTFDLNLYNDEGNSIDCAGTTVAGGDAYYDVQYPDFGAPVVDFHTEITINGQAGDMIRMLVYDVTAACGSAGDISDVDYCEDITLTGGDDVFDWGGLTSTDGFQREVQIVPVSVSDSMSICATVVLENNTCSHFQNVLPGYDIETPTEVNFNYSSDSGADPVTAGNDLWFAFDPNSGNDNGALVYSTSADVTVTGLGAGEEITILLYQGNGLSANNCLDLAGDYLSTLTITSDGSGTLTCLDEVHGPTDGGYLVRIVQTAGGTMATPTVTVTPSVPGPFNNDCENIWDGSGPQNTGTSDAAHQFSAWHVLDGETISSNFTGATDCNPTTASAFCNAVDYEAITESDDRDVWFTFEVPDEQCASLGLTQSTVISSMTLTYDASDAFKDGVLYVYSDCGDGNLIDCSGIVDGAGGDPWTVSGLTQGESYLVRVKPSFLNSDFDYPFDLSVAQGNVEPCNNFHDNAEVLGVGCYSYASLDTFSAQGATPSPHPGVPENDVWFEFTAPSPANGGSYTTAKSWVTVFFESVSGHLLEVELYSHPTPTLIYGNDEDYSVSGVDGKKWAVFGNLTPGQTYLVRLFHKELAAVDVQYKIAINDGPAVETGWGCGTTSMTNISGCASACKELQETWFKIDLPDGTLGFNYWAIEVTGMDQTLDFELRSKFLNPNTSYVACAGAEGATEGGCEDFDHPCSSTNLEAAASLTSTSGPINGCDGNDSLGDIDPSNDTGQGSDGDTNIGTGVRKVYFNLNGAVPGQKDYYYLRVFIDPSDPRYNEWGEVKICNISFSGPYSTEALADAGGAPDLTCISGSISGKVFLDNYADGTTDNLNGDGTGTDADIEGITVTLYDCGADNDCATAGDNSVFNTTTSAADGTYTFTGLPDGNYYVNYGLDDGTTTYDAFTTQDVSSNSQDGIDSDADGSGNTGTITISGASAESNIDAGMYEYATILGTLFEDNNGTVGINPVADGTMDVIVVTYCDDPPTCASTTNVNYNITASGGGAFSIPNVIPGVILAINATSYSAFEDPTVVNAQTLAANSGGSLTSQNFALPVEMTYFIGEEVKGKNVLSWATESEINSLKFIIERNGESDKGFVPIGEMAAAGFSDYLIEYTLADEHFIAGTNYYRLKTIDFDGSFEYSKTISIHNSARDVILHAFPVPAQEMININFELSQEKEVVFELIDVLGRSIKQQKVLANEGGNTTDFDLNGLNDGVYIIRMTAGGVKQTLRIVKQSK